ncbi:MAG: ribonuclease HI [Treponema sp.]|nr:ribonuclease HI [Treponema sp.]
MEASLTYSPLKIFTDGGCSGNPGPGGWAYIIVQETFQGHTLLAEEFGGEKATTNNRMELIAVINSLQTLKNRNASERNASVPRKAVVYTDSQYVQKGITEWIHKWKQNSWRTSDKKSVKNQDLWVELEAISGELTLQGVTLNWEWVRGHSGIEYNERCDRMTQQAIASVQKNA